MDDKIHTKDETLAILAAELGLMDLAGTEPQLHTEGSLEPLSTFSKEPSSLRLP